MITIANRAGKSKKEQIFSESYRYSEVCQYLDSLKSYEYGPESVRRMQSLDKAFDYPSKKLDIIAVGGTNGKSSTIYFAAKLLKEEGFSVGMTFSSHFLTYNERMYNDFLSISNKSFASVVTSVMNMAQRIGIVPTTFEIITFASLLHFSLHNVQIGLFEVGDGGSYDPIKALQPIVAGVTRVAIDGVSRFGSDLNKTTEDMVNIASRGAWFVSAEQSKIRLQYMKSIAEKNGINWTMPIRKLARLPYIYEQLYGRSASLGERMAQIYVENVKGKFSPFLRGNLLATKRGQRGRPTLEAKRHAELNPVKTLKSFWLENFDLLRGRFELLEKERPTMLLDNACNLDALENVFLGIRLLHYQRPLKGLALILGFTKSVDVLIVAKLVRYLFKKVTGHLYVVPVSNVPSHNTSEVMATVRELNIRAHECSSLAQALDQAKEFVDNRYGLVALTGSSLLISDYWQLRGVKKL